MCDERGCKECKDGYIALEGCPVDYVGHEIVEVCNLASVCEDTGVLPITGGLLEQSAAFMDVVHQLKSEHRRIVAEIRKDGRR